MRFLPVFLDLATGIVVLAGSGEPAMAKLRMLRAAGARVRWHVDEVAAAREVHDDEAIEIVCGYAEVDLSDAVAVVVATGEPHDAAIAARARSLRLPVNVVDRPDLSTFIVPAIVDRGDVVVAIGTSGAAPVLARWLRERIEALLPARIGGLAALMGRYRARLAAVTGGSVARRRFWERVVDGPIGAALLAGRPLAAEAALVRAIDAADRAAREPGSIFFVNAGSGDPDLLTLRALHALQNTDIVFHDDDVPAALLDRVRRDAERVVAEPGGIKRALIAAARAGRRVVRLHGMTSSIEEYEFLCAAGVPATVIPGVGVQGASPMVVREAA